MKHSKFRLLFLALYFIIACESARAIRVPTVTLIADKERVKWQVMDTEFEDAESAGKAIRRLLELDSDLIFFLICDKRLSVGQLQAAIDALYQMGIRKILFHRIRGDLMDPAIGKCTTLRHDSFRRMGRQEGMEQGIGVTSRHSSIGLTEGERIGGRPPMSSSTAPGGRKAPASSIPPRATTRPRPSPS